MPIVRAEALTVRYGSREALSSLDLTVEGGVTGLLGPNGAGKSTLLKTLLGFVEPASGRVEVLGQPVSRASTELRRHLGYFPERSTLIPELNAVSAVALAGEIGGLPRKDALARAHEMLWFTGLGEARYRPVEEFSTGMRQRTKLSMALVHDPDLILLDEPTSGLDPAGRRQMLDLVREVGKRGISVLLSTHLLRDVEEVSERVIVLRGGRLVVEGRLSDLAESPGWVYEIRVREDEPGRFQEELGRRGIAWTEEQDGLLRIELAEPATRLFFETARDAGAEIRHLRRFEKSLEEQFLSAVAPMGRFTREGSEPSEERGEH